MLTAGANQRCIFYPLCSTWKLFFPCYILGAKTKQGCICVLYKQSAVDGSCMQSVCLSTTDIRIRFFLVAKLQSFSRDVHSSELEPESKTLTLPPMPPVSLLSHLICRASSSWNHFGKPTSWKANLLYAASMIDSLSRLRSIFLASARTSALP